LSYPDPLYFDYSASTPPFPEALEKFRDISMRFLANPSSLHQVGRKARKRFLEAKKSFCDLLHFSDGRVLLCSSGTEANNTIIEGHRLRFPEGRLLIAEDTHDCIWYAREKHPDHTDVLGVDRSGQIDPDQFIEAIRPTTTLVCINHVCNELGTIHPVADFADICAARGIRLLVDGAQAMGHIPVDLGQIAATYYSFSAHKFGGPRSVGGIFIRDSDFEPLLHGGRQEWELRASTENLAGLVATITAFEQCLTSMETEKDRLHELMDHFLKEVKSEVPKVLINSPAERLPGFVSLSVPGFLGTEIVAALSLSGHALSTGSACHENQITPSRVITAMGRSAEEARGTIRISMGRGTTSLSVQRLTRALIEFLL
jgi:cysteine desulfurase